jgi:hypothetical protein
MDGQWILHGDELADELAALLSREPSGLACNELARRLRRRRGDVLDALRWDPRFGRCGGGRGSRWRMTAAMPQVSSVEGPRDVLGRKDRDSHVPEPIPGKTAAPEALAARGEP